MKNTNWSIAQRLYGVIFGLLTVILIVGLVGFFEGEKTINRFSSTINDRVIPLNQLKKISDAYAIDIVDTIHKVRDGSIKPNDGISNIKRAEETIKLQWKAYTATELTPEEKSLISTTESYFGSADKASDQAIQLLGADDKEAIREFAANTLYPAIDPVTSAISKLVDLQLKLAHEQLTSSQKAHQRASIINGVIILVSLVVFSFFSLGLAAEIRSRMNRLSKLVLHASETLDFTTRIKITRQDELGNTATAFNKLLERLQDNLKTVSTSAASVASAAISMSTTSTQVATASHQQSAAASNMAATVEEMTVSVNHVADRANETQAIARNAGQLATQGEQVISQTKDAIREIESTASDASEAIHSLERSSQEIAVVVAVIKEVADQTNLLALNAAIEAARAGEQGRGFAVVADEVRKLAERTSSSTVQIAHTINTMQVSATQAVSSMKNVVDKVNIGVRYTEDAHTAMNQIGEGGRQSAGMMEEIATAIHEQGAATNNIANQVEKIAQMSEESSAAAAESARSAQELDRLASEMQKIVSAYRLDGQSLAG